MFKLTNLIVILSLCCIVANAAPYQELAPKPGYVPVYIREGNTPLSKIHPKLVEAFHEDEQSNKLQLEAIKPEEALLPINNNNEETVNDKSIVNNEAKYIDESTDNESAKIEETTASDIAELNNDDLKRFANDEAEH